MCWPSQVGALLGALLLLAGALGCDSGEADKASRAGSTPTMASPSSAETAGAIPSNSASRDSEGVVAVRRAADTGFLSLRIDEAALARIGDAVHVQVRVACKYVPERGQWQRLPASPTRIAYRMEPRPAAEANAPERLLYEMPREAGLYWVLWIEERERGGVKGATQEHQAIGVTDDPSCAAPRGPGAPGQVAACVPGDGEARWVADPGVACADLR